MTSSTTRRIPTLIAVLAVWLFCLALAFYSDPHGLDIRADQLIGKGIRDGLPADTPISDLSAIYGEEVPYWWAGPRPPAASLLNVAIAPADPDVLATVMTILNISATVAIVALSAKMAAFDVGKVIVLTPLLFITPLGQIIIDFGNLAPLVALGVVATWYLRDGWWAGIPLGLSGGIRLFPVVFALCLFVSGRRKAGVAAMATAVGLNLAGLAHPGINLTDSLTALTDGQVFLLHPGNGSLPSTLLIYTGLSPTVTSILAIVMVVGLVVWLLTTRPKNALAVGVPLMLLAGPITWPLYLLMAGPVLAATRLLPIIFGVWCLSLFGIPVGITTTVSLLLLLYSSIRPWGWKSKTKRPAPALSGRGAGVKGTRKTDVPVTADV